MEPVLLTPEEAAEALRVGRSKVYQLMAAGSLPSVKVGNRRRVPVEGLRQYVERLLTGGRVA